MDALTILVTSGAAATGSLVTGYVLKLVEHRRALKNSSRSEIARLQAVASFEAVRAILGNSRELFHAVTRTISNGGQDDFHKGRIDYASRELRRLARINADVLGEQHVQIVNDLTDAAVAVMNFRPDPGGENLIPLDDLAQEFQAAWGRFQLCVIEQQQRRLQIGSRLTERQALETSVQMPQSEP